MAKIEKKKAAKKEAKPVVAKERKELKDTTKGYLNSKAPPIVHPNKDEMGKAPLKENTEIELKYDAKQMADKAEKLVKALLKKGELIEEKKNFDADLSVKIKAQDTIIEELYTQLDKKHEMKMVTCEVKRNYTTQKREYYYNDVKVKEEPLRKSDHQLDAYADDKGKSNLKVVKTFDLKLKKGDWVRTKKGNTVCITEEDLLNLNYDTIERLATNAEIEQSEKADKHKKDQEGKK